LTSPTHDPNPENNQVRTSISSQEASSLVIEKSVDVVTPSIGSAVTFTVTVTNNGPIATEATVVDALPAGLTYVSHTTATGTYVITPTDPEDVWAVGTLTTGQSAVLTIITLVTLRGPHVNIATVNANVQNINAANNFASATVNGSSPAPLPSLSGWGLALLGISLLAIAAWRFRRMRDQRIL